MFGFNRFETAEDSDSWKPSDDSTEGKLWQTLRSVPEASHLGLALPRFLARLPYGEKTDPIEACCLEEFTGIAKHQKYLWSNPIFIVALLLAKTFRKYSWDMSGNYIQDVDGLPLYVYQEDGESKTKPCTEITFTENNYEKILEQGLIPLISFRDTDRIRLGRVQSVSKVLSPLKGRWK
jgi:type VI secretion system protein ImpC